jgi:hypothetical protein
MKHAMWEDVLKIGLAAAVIAVAVPDPAFAQALGDSVGEVKGGMRNMPIVLKTDTANELGFIALKEIS